MLIADPQFRTRIGSRTAASGQPPTARLDRYQSTTASVAAAAAAATESHSAGRPLARPPRRHPRQRRRRFSIPPLRRGCAQKQRAGGSDGRA
jgi:hypothetical protein